MLPLKKTIIDGNPVLQWLMPIPVQWLIERDWWVQTHWEDGDSREVYRQLLRSPIPEGHGVDSQVAAGSEGNGCPH